MTVGGNSSLLLLHFYRLGSSCTFQLLMTIGTGWKAHTSYLMLSKTTLDSLSSTGSWLGMGATGSSQSSWLASWSVHIQEYLGSLVTQCTCLLQGKTKSLANWPKVTASKDLNEILKKQNKPHIFIAYSSSVVTCAPHLGAIDFWGSLAIKKMGIIELSKGILCWEE